MAQINEEIRSRFWGLGRYQSVLLLLLLVQAIALCIKPALHMDDVSPAAKASHNSAKPDITNDDLRLYRLITDRVSKGETYYAAAFAEHRVNEYPTKPFVTVRIPTLAVLSAAANPGMIGLAFALLAIGALLVWLRQIDNAFRDPGRRITAVMLIASGLIMGAIPRYFVLHELWAGAFIALSLGLYRPQNFWPAILAAAAALSVRETALPFVLLMAAFAVFERRWREVAAWSALIALFSVVLFYHANIVNSLFMADDISSPGWLRLGGLQAMVGAMAKTSALRILPEILAAFVIPLALFGWISWRGKIGARGTLYIAGYGFMLMIIGRPENFYWGLMVAPLLLLGLAFVPQAFGDVIHNLRTGRSKALA